MGHCESFNPTELNRLGKRIISVVAPQMAEDVEARALAKLESDARHATQLSMRVNGGGTTAIRATVPDPWR